MESHKTACLVEFGGHNEVLSTVGKTLLAKEVALQILCSQAIYNLCSDLHMEDSITWHIDQLGNTNRFLQAKFDVIKSCDFVLITTLEAEGRNFVNMDWPTRSIAIIHDLNITFEPFDNFKQYASFDFGFLMRSLKYLKATLTGENRRRRNALSCIDHVLVPSVDILNYAENQPWFGESKIIGALPFYAFEQFIKEEQKDNMVIIIPGTVSNKSRDYDLLYDVLLETKFSSPAAVVLLGSFGKESDKAIIRKFKRLRINNLTVIAFEQSIPQKTFDELLGFSDFIISPLKTHKEYIFSIEEIGKSTISGNINDILKYGKPAILPKSFPVDKDMMPLIEQYSDKDELAKILQEWVEHKFFVQKTSSFSTTSYRMSIEARGTELLQLLSKSI